MNAPSFEIEDREAWLAEHRSYLGGTGVAALLGMNAYKSPHKLYLEIVHGEYDRAGIKADMGTYLEPLVRSRYEKENDVEVKPAGLVRHPSYDFLGVNPDGFIGDDGGLECKTYDFSTAIHWGESGEPQKDKQSYVPNPYYCQSQWGMTITGRKWWDIRALHRTTGEERQYRIYNDPKLSDIMMEKAVEFWLNHVVPKVPPPLTGHSSDLDYLKAQYPTDRGGSCIATASVEKVVDRLKEAWIKKDEAKNEFDAAKSLIQDFMEDNSICETMHGTITWRRSKDSIGTKWDKVLTGLTAYSSIALDPEVHVMLMKERDRLIAEFTGVTKQGSRRFLVPFGDGE